MAEPTRSTGVHVAPMQALDIHPGMGSQALPHSGKAPSPTRSADFIPSGRQGIEIGVNTGAAPNLDPREVVAPPAPPTAPGLPQAEPQIQHQGQPQPVAPAVTQAATPPPEQPDMAALLAETNKKYGDLLRNIGEMKATHAQEIAEARFQSEVQSAPALIAPAPILEERLPAGMDPESNPTLQQIHDINRNMVPLVRADATASAIRAIWDVTQPEFDQAIRDYPGIAQRQEPEQTQFILRAVKLQRQRTNNAEESPPVVAAQPVPQTPEAHVVPMVEGLTQTPNVAEPTQPSGALEQAQKEYNAAELAVANAETDLLRRQAMKQQRVAFDRLNDVMGRGQDLQKHEGFTQTA